MRPSRCRRLALVTRDPGLVEERVLESLRSLGYTVALVESGSLEPGRLASELGESGFDCAIVPGSAPHDYGGLGRGPLIVKGPVSPRLLPYLLSRARPEDLSPSVQAEKALGRGLMEEVVLEVLGDAWREAVEAFTVGGLAVPRRPPPILVASEVYLRGGMSVEGLVEEAAYRARMGADMVVLGAIPGEVSKARYLEAVEAVLSGLGAPLAVDPGDPGLMVEGLEAGAHVGMSLTASQLPLVPRRLREEKAFVLIPEFMGGPWERASELKRAWERASELGYERVLLDPVVNPPVNGGSLASLIAAWRLSGEVEAPILMGINNAYEMVDADTQGSIGVLVPLAGEAGASVVMVTEESFKSRGATLEAKIASLLSTAALYLRTPPKDLGLGLLLSKGKSPGDLHPGAEYLGRGLYKVPGLEALVDCLGRGPGGAPGELCIPWSRIRVGIPPGPREARA